MRWTRAAAAGLILITLSGCVSQHLGRFRTGSTLYSGDPELLSDLLNRMLRREFRLETLPETWRVSERVLTRLTGAMEAPSVSYRLVILRTGLPNAFALPDGKLYVTTGLLRIVDSEEGLAGVLAHEIGHVEMNHYRERIRRTEITLGIGRLFTQVFDQGEELDADAYGIELARKAGFGTAGFRDFLQRLRHMENVQGIRFGGLFSSHPGLNRRIEALPAVQPATRKGDPSGFRAMKDAIRGRLARTVPQAEWQEDPPRVRDAADRVRSGTDLRGTTGILEGLARSKEEKVSDAARIWLARVRILQADYAEASEELDRAAAGAHSPESLPWLRITLARLTDGASRAEDLWNREVGRKGCAENPECLRLAVETGLVIAPEAETLDGLVARYRNLLVEGGGSVAENHARTLSRAGHVEVDRNIRRKSAERSRERRYPEGFRPAPLLREWLELESEYLRTGAELPYRERWQGITLTAGAGGFGGQLTGITGSGGMLRLASETGDWPWSWGLGWTSHFRRDGILPGGVPAYTSAWEVGFHVRREWSSGRLRTWNTVRLAWAKVTRESPDRSLTSGWGLGAAAGLSYRINRSRAPVESRIELGLGAGHFWFKPVAAGLRGPVPGWTATLGIRFAMSPSLADDLFESSPSYRLGRPSPLFD